MPDWSDPDNRAEELAEKARALFQKGRYKEAEACLREAIELDPDHGAWRMNLGVTLQALGRTDEALRCFELASARSPDHAEPRVAAAVAAASLQRWQLALKWAEEATQRKPDIDAAWAVRIESLRRLGRREDASLAFYLSQQHLEASPATLQAMAEVLLEEGKTERAAWSLREALRLEPSLARVRIRLAQLAADGGQPHRAIELLTEETRHHPGDVQAWIAFGDLLVRLRRAPEAAEKYRRAVELDPDSAAARWRMGSLALAARRLDEACAELEMAMRLDADNPAPRVELAHARLERGERDEAARLLEVHAERTPPEQDPRLDNPQGAVSLAELMLRADRPAMAARTLSAALRFAACRKDAALFRKLALARYRSGDLKGGDEASQHLHRLDASDAAAPYNLALSALQRGNLTEAATWARRGLSEHPRDAGLRRVLLRIWMARFIPWLRKATPSDIGHASGDA
jgi:tetratricopeptide (TPR) repeat protein